MVDDVAETGRRVVWRSSALSEVGHVLQVILRGRWIVGAVLAGWRRWELRCGEGDGENDINLIYALWSESEKIEFEKSETENNLLTSSMSNDPR